MRITTIGRKPEPGGEGEPTGKPFDVSPVELPPDEAEDRLRLTRENEMREMSWEHLKAAHERFRQAENEGEGEDAWHESHYAISLLHVYRALIGDGDGQRLQVVMGDLEGDED